MKVLYYDLFCGISGDMNLGALIDLGVDVAYLKKELKKLNIDEEFDLLVKTDMKHGISGTKADVVLFNQAGHEEDHNHHGHDTSHKHSHDESHSHPHPHDEKHEDNHSHSHRHNETHSHEHRTFATIRDMINQSGLSESVKTLSIEIFRLIAVAEGKVHGKPVDEVHFHEVGATDSIVDIVGGAICIDALKVDKIMASTVQVGGGFVRCAHGKMPVPAPATAEILKGVPIQYNVVPFETTTPTGAAILKAVVSEYTDQHTFTIHKVGYGLGNKDFDIPNITRVYLGEIADQSKDLLVEEQFVMSCNIDDMSGELYGYIEPKLFEAGALDVYKTAIIMKKGRPATKLSLLFKGEHRAELQKILFEETTTAGVRESKVTKYMMQRTSEDIDTSYGRVSVKHLWLEGAIVKSKPEYEACLALAQTHNVSIRDIQKEVAHVLQNR